MLTGTLKQLSLLCTVSLFFKLAIFVEIQ